MPKLVEPNLTCRSCGSEISVREAALYGLACERCGGDPQQTEAGVAPGSSEQPGGEVRGPGNLAVAEVLLPTASALDAESVQQFAAALPTPISLEYFGGAGRRSMLIRARKQSVQAVANRVPSAWPGARLQILDTDPLDLMNRSFGVQPFSAAFSLQKPGYVPYRTLDRQGSTDPVQALLDALLGLADQESLWIQILVVRRGEPAWLPGVQRRLKAEKQRGYVVSSDEAHHTPGSEGSQFPSLAGNRIIRGFLFLLGLISLLVLAVLLAIRPSWTSIAAGIAFILLVAGTMKLLDQPEDPWSASPTELVAAKVVEQGVFFEVFLRAVAWANSTARGMDLLSRVNDALGVYSLAGGNQFLPVDDPYHDQVPWPVDASERSQCSLPLSSEELAALWHIPAVEDRLSLGQAAVSGVEVRAPDPRDVGGRYELGHCILGDGGTRPVFLSDAALERNTLLVGKPGTGKTNTMIHLALAGMGHPDRPALVIVDPHGDMAETLYGAIDPRDKDRIRILDLGDREFALTINPLDPHREGWDVLSSANSVVDIGRSLWKQFWGPRMQDPAKNCLKLIAAANEGRGREDLLGPSLLGQLVSADQETFKRFIEAELEDSPYRDELSRWGLGFFHRLSKYRREDMGLSIVYKANRFAEEPLLHLFSAPKSVLDLGELIRKRQVLIINTRKSHYGVEVSDFVGSLLINLVLRQIARQGEMKAGERNPVLVIVDEFQSFSGVGWKEALGETRKHGGRFIIGTQNFASLKADRDELDLRGQILGAVQPLFVFQVSGEDAEYLSGKELAGKSGGPSPETLTKLEPFRAYARLVRDDGQVTHPFYFETAKPPEVNSNLADEVLAMRASYSLRQKEADAGARRQLALLDRYSRSFVSQGDPGAARGRGGGASAVRRSMRAAMGEERTAEYEVRRALLGEVGTVAMQEGHEEAGPSAADGISPEMFELLEAKLRPPEEAPSPDESGDMDPEGEG